MRIDRDMDEGPVNIMISGALAGRASTLAGKSWGLALAVLSHACLALSVSAQSPSGQVRIQVVDAGAMPVSEAEVVLGGDKRPTFSTRTDSAGLALIANVPSGLWTMTVRRIGLKPVTGSIRVAPGRNAYTVRVDESAMTLVGMRVVGDRTYSARLDEFERRRLAGTPSAVVTQEDIDRIGPVQISRMLRGLAGIRVADSMGTTVAISNRGTQPFRPKNGSSNFALVQCVLRVSVDGIPLPGLADLDQLVPKDVHGIEVYFGPARMPPELAALRTDNWCGLIAVWTRDR